MPRPAITSSISALDRINISTLLRPQSINKLITTGKAICIGLILLFLVIILRELIDSSVNSLVSSLAKSAAQSSSAQNTAASQAPIVRQDYSIITKQNIFGKIAALDTKPTISTPAKPPSTLPLSLIGTIISSGEKPYAIIENQKKHEQDAFRIGEMVFEEAKLVTIMPDRVEIERNGQIEVLNLDDEVAGPSAPIQGGVASVGNDEFVIQEAELDKALENLPMLLQQARAVPYFKDGKSVGLRLFAIKPDSLFAKIGLNNGDVLKEANGKSLADPSQALTLFEELKSERSINVLLERANQPREFKYQIR